MSLSASWPEGELKYIKETIFVVLYIYIYIRPIERQSVFKDKEP